MNRLATLLISRPALVEEKIDRLMEKLSQSQQDMDAKLTSAMSEFKREVASVQLAQAERTTQELSRKIAGPSYQFRKKGNEMQFKFNVEV